MTDWKQELIDGIKSILDDAAFIKTKAVIRKDGPASKPYCIYSETGKKLGCYPSKKAAQDRLKKIEMFKHMKDKKDGTNG